MQKGLEHIEEELSKRIYDLFLKKFNGNKSEFARAAHCRETTIRRILKNEQSITFNLLLRIANALDVQLETLVKGLSIEDKD